MKKSLNEVQQQFTRLKKIHLALKEKNKSSSSLTSPTDERVGPQATPRPATTPTEVENNTAVSLFGIL